MISRFTTCAVVSIRQTKTMRDRLSILVYIESGVLYLMSCPESYISPKYTLRKNKTEKEPNYFKSSLHCWTITFADHIQ